MYTVQIRKKPKKFIDSLPKKHKRQVKDYILNLRNNPRPHDSKNLAGHKPYFRGDIGEYRVVYKYSQNEKTITISVIGKRNDSEVYKKLERML